MWTKPRSYCRRVDLPYSQPVISVMLQRRQSPLWISYLTVLCDIVSSSRAINSACALDQRLMTPACTRDHFADNSYPFPVLFVECVLRVEIVRTCFRKRRVSKISSSNIMVYVWMSIQTCHCQILYLLHKFSARNSSAHACVIMLTRILYTVFACDRAVPLSTDKFSAKSTAHQRNCSTGLY